MNAISLGNPSALAGIKVVEMGQLLAGPFCGQLLGDMGADVVKIEPPGAVTITASGAAVAVETSTVEAADRAWRRRRVIPHAHPGASRPQ